MKVILQADVKSQGKKGQMIEVSDGYARNFLLPKKLAILATADNMNAMKQADEAAVRKIALEKAAANEAKAALEAITVQLTAKGGTGGRLFGAITTKEIAEQIKAQFGLEVDKQKLVMEDHIKSFGSYEIKIKLYKDVIGKVKVQVSEQS